MSITVADPKPRAKASKRREGDVKRTYRYRLYPTDEQADRMSKWFDGCRWLWNEAIEHNQRRWKAGVKLENSQALMAAIPAARQIEGSPLADVPGVWAQGVLRQQGEAWARHWSQWKAGEDSSPPTFRSWAKSQSVRFVVQEHYQPATPSYLIREMETGSARFAQVWIMKLGWVVFRNDRDGALPADALCGSMVVRLDELGRWWVLFQCDVPAPPREATGKIAGVDLGVTRSVVTDEGQFLDMPGMTAGEAKRRHMLERSMARSRRLNPCPADRWEVVKGRPKLITGRCECAAGGCWKQSRRYQRTKTSVAKIRDRVTNRIEDASHKASAALAAENDVVVFEDLDIKGMTKSSRHREGPPRPGSSGKRGLNRSILAQGWGRTKAMTAYKTTVVSVDPRYTSRTCAECGHVDKASRKSQAVFRCTNCGFEDNADRNAARVIRQRGIDLLAGESPSSAVTQTVAGRGGDRIERPDEPSTLVQAETPAPHPPPTPLTPLVPPEWGVKADRYQLHRVRRGRTVGRAKRAHWETPTDRGAGTLEADPCEAGTSKDSDCDAGTSGDAWTHWEGEMSMDGVRLGRARPTPLGC